jgi:hypothetical protein
MGQPISLTEGGDIFIATWHSEEVSAMAMPIGMFVWAVPLCQGWDLQLIFDKTTGKMISWKYRQW